MKPTVPQQVHLEAVQAHPKMENLKNTYIKNAESITYESSATQNQLGEFRKEFRQEEEGRANILENMKKENLVSHDDEQEDREQDNQQEEG